MPEKVHPYVQVLTEGSVPAPPPVPRNYSEFEEEATDESRNSVIGRIWDLALIFGPVSDLSLIARLNLSSAAFPIREYATIHEERVQAGDKAWAAKAEKWYGEQRIAQCLARGWLRRDSSGLLVAGTCPPSHKPLEGVGHRKGLRNLVLGLDNRIAMEILTKKTNPSRMKPLRFRRDELKASISEVGLLDRKLRRWLPPGQEDYIIINGRTRMEILDELISEGRMTYFQEHDPDRVTFEWETLDSDTPAPEILIQRIHHELHGWTKDASVEGRNAYIEQLAKQGIRQEDIAKAVGLSRQHVSRVLSTVHMDERRRQAGPTDADVAEWKALRDAGWTYRRISGRTQWGKDTIKNYLDRLTAAQAEGNEPTLEELADITDAEAAEILAEGFGENPDNWQAKTPAGRKKKAKEIAPVIEAAKKKGVAVKGAVKGMRSTDTFSALVEAHPETIKVAANSPQVQCAVLDAWDAFGWSDLSLAEVRHRLSRMTERPGLELVTESSA